MLLRIFSHLSRTRGDGDGGDFISFSLKWVLKTNYNQYIKN